MSKSSTKSTPYRKRASIHASPRVHHPISSTQTPLSASLPSFLEMHDEYQDLNQNLESLNVIHESLANFNESFSSFLYGLQINAYTVEFNEISGASKDNEELLKQIETLENYLNDDNNIENNNNDSNNRNSADETYLTNEEDDSFVIEPKSRIPRKSITSIPKPSTRTNSSSLRDNSRNGFTSNSSNSGSRSIPTNRVNKSKANTKSTLNKRPPFR
ncbi:hypothetical protein WICMUC_003761 [Wickerhamomyces mucosus]|uniref:DASH complex subunit DAM1 n=1 Tax=Wickerhamomyces mucosus TaxID=1378264 RepID=A0A9P8PJR8_9ASCO|nr:hypothetical protein WICMUC_003761 [Wickerhamomyces mucosus]